MSFNSPDSQKRYPKQFPSLAYARAILAGNKKYEEDLKQIEETRRLREEGEKKKVDVSPTIKVTPTTEDADTNPTDSTSAHETPPTETTAPIIPKTSPAPQNLPVENTSSSLTKPKQPLEVISSENKYTLNPEGLKMFSNLAREKEKIIDAKRPNIRNFKDLPVEIFHGDKGEVEPGTLFRKKARYTTYSQKLIENDLKTTVERVSKHKSSEEDKANKEISDTMELVFTKYLSQVFPDYETIIPSKMDDNLNGADVTFVKKDSTGKIISIFSLDLFFTADKISELYLRRKILRCLGRAQSNSLSYLNYVQIPNKKNPPSRISAMSVPSFILPISLVNLVKIASEYNLNKKNSEVLESLKYDILNLIKTQAAALTFISGSNGDESQRTKIENSIKIFLEQLGSIDTKEASRVEDGAISKAIEYVNRFTENSRSKRGLLFHKRISEYKKAVESSETQEQIANFDKLNDGEKKNIFKTKKQSKKTEKLLEHVETRTWLEYFKQGLFGKK